MNLILLEDEDFVGAETVRLSGRRHLHVRDVHRAIVGDELRVGRVGGQMGRGEVVSLDDEELVLRVRLDEAPPEPIPMTLLMALPRPKFLKRVLATATMLGVKKIVLFNSYRVDKIYWGCEQLTPEAVREACLLGLEQARDTLLPVVETRRRFKPFLEDEVPAISKGTRAFVAHPIADVECPYAVREPLTLAIGPEGGFIDYEIEHFRRAGFETVKLTERILKVETALSVLIGRLT